jgi:hypothetical protein
MPYTINREKFLSGQSLVEAYQSAKEAPMPKLNVKIRKSDLRIIDSISKQSGVPRSQILNAMIESVVKKMLHDLAVDDKDCAALVAKYADTLSGVSFRSKESWSDVVFEDRNRSLEQYYEQELRERPRDGFSDQYYIIDERLSKEAR